MNTLDFGKMVSKLRKSLGMTQDELAKKLNISDKAVSKWENGIGYPDITQLPALSKIFGVSIDYLLTGNSRGIVIAGNILVDVINIIDKYPEKSMLGTVLEKSIAVGGCVPNTIIDLAKIDRDLYLSAVCKVGDDEYGRFLVSQLKKYGIDVSGIKTSTKFDTSISNVMSDSTTGERTFFYSGGANKDFSIDDIDVDTLDCEIFHIGYVLLLDMLDAKDDEYGTKMARLLHNVSQKGIKTSIDVISSPDQEKFAGAIVPLLKYCNYTMMNEIESCSVTGVSPRKEDGSVDVENIRKTMEYFIDCGVKEKVIVHCCEAGFLMNSKKEFTIVPSLSLPKDYIKGSVGAGDAFAAGCLYGIYQGYDDKKILEFASCAAACNLSSADAISGMKSKEEIEKMETMYKRSVL